MLGLGISLLDEALQCPFVVVPPPTGITAPSLTLTSAAGAAPEWDTTIDATVYAGYYLYIEVSPTSAKNPDGTYSSASKQVVVHQITDQDIATGSIPNSELTADGLQAITGSWFIHEWVQREDGVTSSISNEISGTVTSSVAVYSTSNGVDKSQYLTMTGNLSGTVNATVNTPCNSRVMPAITTKVHFEVTATAIASGTVNGNIVGGICDSGSVQTFATFSAPPGISSSNPGASCMVKYTDGRAFIYYNGALHNVTLTGSVVPAPGDKIIIEYDPATFTVTIKYVPVGTGVVQTLLVPTVLSSCIPATPYAFSGGYNTSDKFTGNFGASAFTVTPTAGYAGW